MVEVFDFQKNFTTGKEIRKSKFKDNSMTKGVATIELFDKDNNLVEKTVSNNFINNPYDSYHIYTHMSKLLQGRNHSYTMPLRARQFGQIHLRSGEFDEDPSTIFMRGDSIGWAERTVTDSGSDTTKGAYNSNESYTEYTEDGYYHAHLVYDFTTSKANGTINHVYWTPYLITNSKKALGCLTPLRIGITSDSHAIDISKASGIPKFDSRGQLWAYVNDTTYYKVINKDRFLQGFESLKYDTESAVTSITSQCRRVNKDYYIETESNYQAGTIANRYGRFTLDLRNTETGESVKSKEFDIINDFPAMKKYNDKITSSSGRFNYNRVLFCTDSGNVYVAFYVNAGSALLPTVSEDGTITANKNSSDYYVGIYNVFDEVWVLEPNPENYLSNTMYDTLSGHYYITMEIKKGEYYLFNHSASTATHYIFDEENLKLSSFGIDYMVSNDGSGGSWSSVANFMGGIDYRNNTALGHGGNTLTLNRFVPYSSHTKLPSPVTKTNTTTMKVTYDYYIQVPNMFAEKGKEFTWE